MRVWGDDHFNLTTVLKFRMQRDDAGDYTVHLCEQDALIRLAETTVFFNQGF